MARLMLLGAALSQAAVGRGGVGLYVGRTRGGYPGFRSCLPSAVPVSSRAATDRGDVGFCRLKSPQMPDELLVAVPDLLLAIPVLQQQ